MTSDRMQRMVDRELDAAEAAFGDGDWATVLQHVEKALRLDPENQEAIALQAAAQDEVAGTVEESLAKARTAATADDWATVLEHADAALALDPDNADARELRDVANEAASGGDRTRVFVSSAMQELKSERDVVKTTLENDRYFDPWLFDRDAHALDHSAQDEWRTQIERRGVGATVVLLWKKLGEWTQDEIEWSRSSGVATLLFIKDDPEGTLHKEHGEYLAELTNPASGLTSRAFRSPAVIGMLVVQSLNDLVKDRLDKHRKADLDSDDPIAGVRRTAERSEHGYRSEEAPVPDATPLDPTLQRFLAPNVSGFVDRSTDTTKLTAVIKSRQFRIVGIVGPPGVGKKALLRNVADDPTLAAAFGDGVAVHPDVDLVALSNRTVATRDGGQSFDEHPGAQPSDPLEDLLQAVWEQFYDADPSSVRPTVRRRQLGKIEALIVLPDADGAIGYVEQLAKVMPRSVICVTLRQAVQQGGAITLDGLADPDHMLAVFESGYLSPVPPEARSDIVALCAKADGNPAAIRLLASRAFDEAFAGEESAGADHSHPLIGWAASLARDSRHSLQGGLVSPEAAEVGAIAAATASPAPRQVLADTVGSMASVDEAHAHRVLVSNSPRYRLNPVLEGTVAQRDDILPELFDHTVAWAHRSDTAEIYANREFVLEMLRWGAEQQRWDQVIELGRAAEPAMAVGGRHGAWKDLLEMVAEAAQSTDVVDRGTLAWALHQLGTRALLRDELKPARLLLHRAFRIRPESDIAGREVTHQNMAIVPGAVTPVALLSSAALIVTSWLAAVLPPSSPDDSVIADVDPDVWLFDTGEEQSFTLRNTGDAAFNVGIFEEREFTVDEAPEFTVNGAPEFTVIRERDCLGKPIEAGKECTFTIRFDGTTDVVRPLDLELTPVGETGSVAGDQTILLLGGPPAP